jgi:2-oxoisovalerate dehydrogenase E1 component
MFLGIPGLRVVAPHRRYDPARLLQQALSHDDGPVLFVEHKLLYGQAVDLAPPAGFDPPEIEAAPYPSLVFRPAGSVAADYTLVSFGHDELAERAMDRLFDEEEWLPDYVLVAQLSPLRVEPVLRSVARTRRLVVIEEGSPAFGFGAEVVAALAEHARFEFRSARVGARDFPVPSARGLEDAILPSVDDAVAAVRRIMVGERH